jgi:16S rRNA G527 N7-methylase RsmG
MAKLTVFETKRKKIGFLKTALAALEAHIFEMVLIHVSEGSTKNM